MSAISHGAPLVSLAAAVALAADAAIEIPYERLKVLFDPRTALIFPWVARLDVLLLAVVLGLCLWVSLAIATGSLVPPPGRLTRQVLVTLPLAVLVGGFFGPVDGLLVLVLAAAVLAIGHVLAGSSRAAVSAALLVGFALRVLTGLAFSLYRLWTTGDGSGVVLDDEASIHYAALQVATALRAGAGDIHDEWRYLSSHYLDLVGFIYAWVAPNLTAVRLVNAGVGALSVAFIYGIGRQAWGPSPALVAAWCAALWPDLVLWSGTGLREALTWWLSLAVCWLVAQRRSPWAPRLVCGLAALFVLSTVRVGAAAALLVGLILAAALTPARPAYQRARWAILPATLIALILVSFSPAFAGGGPSALLGELTPSAIEYRAAQMELVPVLNRDRLNWTPADSVAAQGAGVLVRLRPPGSPTLETGIVAGQVLDSGRTRILLGADTVVEAAPEDLLPLDERTVDLGTVLGRALAGLRYLFVLPPGPPQATWWLAIPDSVVWDGLVLAMAISLRRATRAPTTVLLLSFPIVLTLALAIVSRNLGTAVRHRAMLEPYLLVAAAPLLMDLAAQARVIAATRLRGAWAALSPLRSPAP